MKAHIFLVANPKFQLQILCSSGDMTKNVKLIGIPENDFLCIFIIASSPGVHTFFCLWRVNKKLPQGETSQIAFQRSRSISQKWKIYMLKWAYPPLDQNDANLVKKQNLHDTFFASRTCCKSDTFSVRHDASPTIVFRLGLKHPFFGLEHVNSFSDWRTPMYR